jgi:hypothetical protein
MGNTGSTGSMTDFVLPRAPCSPWLDLSQCSEQYSPYAEPPCSCAMSTPILATKLYIPPPTFNRAYQLK